MPTDLSNFDRFEDNFIDLLRESMEKIAGLGEAYAKDKTTGGGAWGVDTGSSVSSITAYEGKIGDPLHNFSDPDWQHAQQVGSDRYPYNTPAHYQPHVENRDVGENDNPTIILTVFTGYPDPSRDNDAMLEAAVSERLDDAAQYMQSILVGRIKDTFRWNSKSPILIQ